MSPVSATGKVTFYNGTTVLGTSAVRAGQAVLTTILLPTGTNSLFVRYDGDGVYGASVSAMVKQTVDAAVANGFAPAAYHFTGGRTLGAAVADFNGDGKADIAVAVLDGNGVTILLGNGDRTFQTPESYAAGITPLSIATGDFNGDGKADIAVADNGFYFLGNEVRVLLGNGDGTFQPAVAWTTGTGAMSVRWRISTATGKPILPSPARSTAR